MDPNSQPNPGQFMSAEGQPGQGSALMRLMQLRQMGATPQAGATPLPAAPVQTGSPINMPSMRQAGQQQPPQMQGTPPVQGQAPQLPAGGGSMAPVSPTPTTFDPHGESLKIAMQALSNYIGNHGKALEAQHDVPRKTAEAKVIASQASPASSPVS